MNIIDLIIQPPNRGKYHSYNLKEKRGCFKSFIKQPDDIDELYSKLFQNFRKEFGNRFYYSLEEIGQHFE